MLIGGTDKEGHTVAGKVLDKHHSGGRDQNLLLEIAKACIQGRTFHDAQQHGVFPGEKGGVKTRICRSAIEEFGIRPQNDNSPDAGQYFLKLRKNCPAFASTFWFQGRLRLSFSEPSWPQHPAF